MAYRITRGQKGALAGMVSISVLGLCLYLWTMWTACIMVALFVLAVSGFCGYTLTKEDDHGVPEDRGLED